MGSRNGSFYHSIPIPLTRQVSVFIATGGYVGYLPSAPGTAGSVQGLLLSWLLSTWPLYRQIGCTLALSALGVMTATRAERTLGVKDPRAIVVDEIVGMALALVGLPFQAGYVIAAFILFRALDIIKPMAALERLPGGWGIMCDDIAAGILTNLTLQVVRLIIT
jgi:phosphatidylglycerophosphatase A